MPRTPQVILGGKGTAAHLRLGLQGYADDETLRERVNEKLAHWRGLAESPLTDRATAGVCRVVIRSLDQIAADLAPPVPRQMSPPCRRLPSCPRRTSC